MSEVYQGEFSSWEDVVGAFTGTRYYRDKELAEALKMHKKPTEVFYACYDRDGYEGSAVVIWRQGRKYYLLQGSHCSCYGLEQSGFDPEEFASKKLFVAFLEKTKCLYTMDEKYFKDFINKLKSHK